MYDPAFPLPIRARSPWTRWALAVFAGLLVATAVAPTDAAPRKRSSKASVRIRRTAKPAPAPKPSATDLAVAAKLGDMSLDQVIALLQSSADFWERSGPAIKGCDPMTSIVLSLACRERAMELMVQKARMEGDPAAAARVKRELGQAVARAIDTIRAAHKPQQAAGGMGGGMPGMGGPEMGMAPGMPGMPGMGGPEMGMGMPGPGMDPGMGMGGPPGMGMGGPPMP